MTRMLTLAALAAITLGPAAAAAAAQEAPRARPRVRTEVGQRPFGYSFSFSGNRARIGVLVKTDADAAADKIGARLEAVTPGGPAEKAGLKAGDIVTRFGGTGLGGVEAEEEDESGPGMKLIELARELEPGDTVQVEYRRGNDNRRATIVADEVEVRTFPRVEIPDFNGMIFPKMEGMTWWTGHPWGGVELVSLNPDLGEYFGTREGVLVVKASGDSTLPLKGGDVILAIGGRKPTSPAHAMRILGSYETGESVTIDVQRKSRRTTLNWTVPEDGRRVRAFPTPRRTREEPSALLPLKVRRLLTVRAI